MKRLIMMLLLVALAIPATAFAAGPSDGPCSFTKNDKNKTWTLVVDCTTDTTIKVPNGYTLNGNGHTITAVDGDSAFVGAVVENASAGATMHVKNLTVTVNSAALNNCGAVNGVAFMQASGSIKGVTLTHISRNVLDGCNNGRAILVDNIATSPRQSVEISGNVVSDYNKNGIDVRGNVDAKILRNTVTGSASDLVARNGIVVRTGGRGGLGQRRERERVRRLGRRSGRDPRHG